MKLTTLGYRYLEQFRMDIVPTYCYQTDEISIEKSVAMEHGKNTVAVCYTVTGATQPATVELTPLFAMRPMDRVNSPADIARFRSSVFGRTMLVGREDDSRFNAKFYISEGEYADRSLIPTSMAAPTFIAEENQLLAIDARTGFRGLDTQYTPFDAVIRVNPFETKEYLIQADDLNVSGSDYHRSDGESDDGWNVMDLDFEKASASTDSVKLKHLDTYFSNMQPTRRNQYTGMFKGKNLIFLTLEGFSDKVIDPEFTPTLYKMSTEGFVFRNYYNSVWGGSTGSGEYANMTGNIYLNSSCLKKSGDTYQPFALGNQFSALGYRTLAYHNHTYTYYGRNLSHPNFGYEWKAIGNGLVLQSENWPNSDKELAEATVGDYAGIDRPFHVYYMTVSGHCNYSFSGNMMSTRHRYDLPEKYKSDSAEVRAYRACQYEVELMLRVLVDELDKAGKLENTVFAMTADHYPYALSNSSLAELYGLNASGIRGNPELYRNGFILWSPSMKEPVTVDTPCSAIDILPTLSNLFALEYDSRLMMGTDILADGEHIVPLKMDGWSWISTQGEYRCYNSRFYPNEKCTLGSDEMKDYVDTVNRMILAKITYSKNLLDYDYYGHIFGKQHNYDN